MRACLFHARKYSGSTSHIYVMFHLNWVRPIRLDVSHCYLVWPSASACCMGRPRRRCCSSMQRPPDLDRTATSCPLHRDEAPYACIPRVNRGHSQHLTRLCFNDQATLLVVCRFNEPIRWCGRSFVSCSTYVSCASLLPWQTAPPSRL